MGDADAEAIRAARGNWISDTSTPTWPPAAPGATSWT